MTKKKYTLEEFKTTFNNKSNEMFNNFTTEFGCVSMREVDLQRIIMMGSVIVNKLGQKIFEEDKEKDNNDEIMGK